VTTTFSDLGVAPELVARLRARGFTTAFPIQVATIPDALAGRDICGRAPTGSGKTLAFGIAIASRGSEAAPGRPRALVLVPVRELAAQVQRELASLSAGGSRRVIAIYGGTGYTATRQALSRGVDTVVACPGRLEDLLEQRTLDLSAVEIVVVDEADRMADMGFLPAVRRILDLTAPRRQVMLFSATLGPEIEAVVRQYQHDPVRHDVTPPEDSGDVEHLFWHAAREDRVGLTAGLVGTHGRALVFCRTKHGADRLAKQLKGAGVVATAIHGDRTQAQRERALAAFSRGSAQALCATDVAARGIHVEDLPCVVHFDPPADATDYLHRSGRTGRAGKTGIVVSLIMKEHQKATRLLQRALGLEERVHAPSDAVVSRRPSPVLADTPALSERPQRSNWSDRPQRPASSERPQRPDWSERPQRTDWSERPQRSASSERPQRPDWSDRPQRPSRSEGADRRWDRPAAPARANGLARGTAPRPTHPARTTPADRQRPSLGNNSSQFPSHRVPSGRVAARDPYNDKYASQRRNQGVLMPVGTVKFFNSEKGYGFVSRPDGEDVFVHYSNVQGSGYRSLEAGQQVEFEVAPGRKGDEARNVKVI
jgi:superfamily II DNA/RNA helicase/cold shock CspA family protein